MMAGKDNLIPIDTTEKARELGRMGGKKSGESKRRKKSMRELALAILDAPSIDEGARERLMALGIDDSNGAALLLAMLNKGLNGSEEAAKFVRDTSGQAPKQVQQVISGEGMTPEDLRNLSDAELMAMMDSETDDA
jgi:hypothetical protein